MRSLPPRYGVSMVVLILAALLTGCQEAPPGDLRAVSGGGYVGPPDTVKARLLGWKMPSGSLQFERLDSAETAWLEARGYVPVDWHVDSTATYYYRRQADRRPRWDQNTVMTERLYARRNDDQGPGHANHEKRGPWSIVVGTMSDSASARTVMKRYQVRFATTGRSVQVRPVSASDTTLYRVLVGTFDSLGVRRALDQYGPKLPADAWPVRRH